VVLEFTWLNIKIAIIVEPVILLNGKRKVDYETQTLSHTRSHNGIDSDSFDGSQYLS